MDDKDRKSFEVSSDLDLDLDLDEPDDEHDTSRHHHATTAVYSGNGHHTPLTCSLSLGSLKHDNIDEGSIDNMQLSNSISMSNLLLQHHYHNRDHRHHRKITTEIDDTANQIPSSSSSSKGFGSFGSFGSGTTMTRRQCKHEYVLAPSLSMSSLSRPRSLMESLLIAKMEKAGGDTSNVILTNGGLLGGGRTESLGSTSSLTSIASSVSSDVCACDDCLLGIADLSIDTTVEENNKRRKKPSGWRKLRSIVQWTPFFQTYKKQRYPWVQLAGHQGNFRAGREPGTILKKLCLKEEMCFQLLMKDILKPFVPEYKGSIKTEDEERDRSTGYLQLQDLLSEFSAPCVMDCKIGVRTYLEEELAKAKEKPKLRKDMYEKMIQIDPNAPSDEEHRLKGVTKPRYMVWRETISSTATLGFRIEGIRKSDGKSSKDFKTTKTRDQIVEAFRDFVDGFPEVVAKYIRRLNAIKDTLEYSKFFATHEVIGSSLLFVHDKNNASVWLIDFAKTVVLPPDVQINHASEWIVGNHEDGFLIGLNNLIDVFGDLLPPPSSSSSSSSSTNISGSASSVISSAPTDAAAAIRKSASVLPSTVELNSSAIDVT